MKIYRIDNDARSATSFDAFCRALSVTGESILSSLEGCLQQASTDVAIVVAHGNPFGSDIGEYNVVTEAEDVLSGLAALGIARASFIGTSRGGLLLHLLTGMRPAVMESVILNDIGPEIELDGLMLIRRYLQNAPAPRDWAEAAELQKSVHGKMFTALSDEDWKRHARAIYREDKAGRISSDYDPRITETLNSLTPDTQLPALWPQFAGFGHVPLMVIRGENSRLLSERVFREMGAVHTGATLVTVKDQGHAPHLDTADLPERIAAFLGK